MKKIVVLLLLGFASFALIAGNSAHAEGELVDLYPYDQQACLEGTNECTNTKLGSSHWTMEFAGHRYHFVRGADRYLADKTDENSDGFISALELGALSWNAFAALTFNNTDEQIILSTTNARTDLSTVVHRMYSYFDENGNLAMFEDHIGTYYIFNDGTVEAPDWRLATQAEADAFDAAADESKPETTRLTHIRMALDDTDADGYVIEPLGYLKWTNADVDTTVDTDPENWSTIIDGITVAEVELFNGDPNYVVIPAGWTVVSWGTLDRGTANPATTDYIHAMPDYMLDTAVTAATFAYDPQPATFAGISALDDDAATAGTNIVAELSEEFTIPNTISASWLNMYNETDDIINSTEKLDFSLIISQDEVDLETINYTYDSGTDSYTASAAITVIDTSVFLAEYDLRWEVTTPESDVTTAYADLVVGVLPPYFEGVADRFESNGLYVDLLEGISADDGYGVDITDSIIVTYPENLNPYNPMPGTYEIDLEFTLEDSIISTFPSVIFGGEEYIIDGTTNEVVPHFAANINFFDDVTNLKLSTFSWGSAGVVIEVAGDGTVIQTINRRTWDLVDETNTADDPADGAGVFADWIANMTLEEGGFVVVVGASTGDAYTEARALNFGDSVTLGEVVSEYEYSIPKEASYTLTIDDTTAPILIVVNENYKIEQDDFDSINDAILSNVVAYDLTDSQADLVMYVSDNGGLNLTTPGTYTVEVTVEDVAGHTDAKSFDIIVREARITEADIEALIEDNTLSAADIQALIEAEVFTEADIVALIEANVLSEEDVQDLIDAGVITEAQIQALIDASLPEDTGCGSAITGTSAIFATFSILLGAAAIFFIRKRR
jgi:hypothetical protein